MTTPLTVVELMNFVKFTASTDTVICRGAPLGELVGFYCMGLVGETAEYIVETHPAKLVSEAGDPLWYWARLLSLCIHHRTAAFASNLTSWLRDELRAGWIRQDQAVMATHEPPLDALLELAVAGGRICEQGKRVVREDTTSDLLTERFKTLESLLADWYTCWMDAILLHDLDPVEVVNTNKTKLIRRMREGKLHGAGSDR